MGFMQFNFGLNWKEFSLKALSEERVESARRDFRALIGDIQLENKTFLDIGCGQGLSALIASEEHADVVCNDINHISEQLLKLNKAHFDISNPITFIKGSILEKSIIEKIKECHTEYDIVHSWGVVHHTGNMYSAIDALCNLVKKEGYLVLAIYNRHWSSPYWKLIKYLYNKSPNLIRRMMICLFYYIIYIAKYLVTHKSPMEKQRGMDFYYDVIDWVGGYPYEYASIQEISDYVETKGFKLVKSISAEVPTGCNEMIFKRV